MIKNVPILGGHPQPPSLSDDNCGPKRQLHCTQYLIMNPIIYITDGVLVKKACPQKYPYFDDIIILLGSCSSHCFSKNLYSTPLYYWFQTNPRPYIANFATLLPFFPPVVSHFYNFFKQQ